MPIEVPLTPRQKELFEIVYKAVSRSGGADPARAIAAVRLLLIDAVGEESERALTERWNDDPAEPDYADVNLCRELAASGIAFEFVSSGMPLKWAQRFHHLFADLPPVNQPYDAATCAERREQLRLAGAFGQARLWGNQRIALAILEGDADVVRQHALANLEILEQWRSIEPDLGREYEFEEHAWLRDHAAEVAHWGLSVRHRIDNMKG